MNRLWKHKDHEGVFHGTHRFVTVNGEKERVFIVSRGKQIFSFESHQQAKKQGWKSYAASSKVK